MKLVEDSKTGIHIYQDDVTGDRYYFDGKKLVKIGTTPSPTIGDMGDEDERAENRKHHEEEIAKEREENPEEFEDESEEDKQKRLDRIKDMLTDTEMGKEVEAETTAKVNKELKKIKAKDSEARKYTSSIQRFSASLEKFVKDQIRKIKVGTWRVSNPRYEGSGILRRGKRKEESKNIPLINVYFDQSGSWGESDIKLGEEAIGVLNNYVDRGEIKIKVYFFANSIHDNAAAARSEGGTGAGALLIEHIQATKPTNVIVMTDDDFDSWGEINSAPKIMVPGAVWFLFRGAESKLLEEHLSGKAQTRKYFI